MSSVVDLYAPWSLSKSDTAAKCPLAFKKQYIEKQQRAEGTHAKIGVAAHRVQELLLMGEDPDRCLAQGLADNPRLTDKEIETVKALMPALVSFCKRIDSFADRHPIKEVHLEQKLGIRKDGSACAFDAPDAFFRGVIDFVIILESGRAVIIDHKSGKVRPIDYYAKQLDAYTVLVMAHFPEIIGSQGALHYMGAEHIDWYVTRDRATTQKMLVPYLMGLLRERAERLGEFNPKLSNLCGWCDFKHLCDAYAGSIYFKKEPKPRGKKLETI